MKQETTPQHKAPPTEVAQKPAQPRRITIGAVLTPGDQPAPADTFDLWAAAMLFAGCPELDAAQAIVHNERRRRSQHHIHDLEIERLRRLTAEAEARRPA